MKHSTTYILVMGAIVVGATAGAIHNWKDSSATPVSKPEIVFEVPKKPIMECEAAGNVSQNELARCTDKERDVTCYIIRPGGSSTSMSCLPNQWLNYPQSIANQNDPIQTEK